MKRLYIIGIGPGDQKYMTHEAEEALRESELVVGYEVYINLIKDYHKEKDYYSTGMGDEKRRCLYAIEQAEKGRTTAVISSGDAGVYGMASLVLQTEAERKSISASEEKGNKNFGEGVDITIIPGITAALSGAAKLGAPIGNDFAVISLSTALTPWEVIEKRIRNAVEGDFVIVIYNPKSRHRRKTLDMACDIISDYVGCNRPAGYVKNVGRDKEVTCVCTVSELKDAEIDMFTTVFIGNSTTEIIDGRLITGRKYLN